MTCAVLLSCAVTAACGKKGPPLLPYVRVPAAAEVTAARRVGNDVYITVTVPATNLDESKPASIQRIEVWGVTAATSPPGAVHDHRHARGRDPRRPRR